MAWLEVSELTPIQMVKFAAGRHRVRLADGRPAALVRWPITGYGRCRLETPRGQTFSLDAGRVVAVDDEVSVGKAIHLVV